ncbi:YtxH domain-containing protein [Leifsonia sp. AG29]|uniref:YtxH domain-containing protein n=1 Tax=Leifsonia sp. AG29 TaxID=2598860 RepID=UPI0018EF0A16|nr:YtxH domain-containing protein [Leifsonia sp. AG29]
MRGKLIFAAGAAVGYVLGTRAGRERYEQIRAAASRVWESPVVQDQVHAVEEFVSQTVGDLPDTVYVTAKRFAGRAAQRRREARGYRTMRPAEPAPTAAGPDAASS